MRGRGFGLLRSIGRYCWQEPKKICVGIICTTAVVAVVGNALFLQSARHPAPFFAKKIPAASDAKKRVARKDNSGARPLIVQRKASGNLTAISRPHVPKMRNRRSADIKGEGPKSKLSTPAIDAPRDIFPDNVRKVSVRRTEQTRAKIDPIGALIGTGSLVPPADIPNIPKADPRVAAVQKALVKLGFDLKVDGLSGPATNRAIAKFERSNGLKTSTKSKQHIANRTIRALATKSGMDIPRQR